MVGVFVQVIKYWLIAVPYPGRSILEIQQNPKKMEISFGNAFIFSAAYTLTVAIFYFVSRRPIAFPPWLPIPENVYYLAQVFFTIPWGLATWIMLSGVGHLGSMIGRYGCESYHFEDATIAVGFAWIVPAFYTQWLPETFIAPFGDFWPFWIDILRIMIVPVIWQITMTAIGLRVTHKISWLRGILLGIVITLLGFIMFVTFIR